jgi:tetratricopeptide (TPR) repeat protein
MNVSIGQPAMAGPNGPAGGDAALSPEHPFPGLRPFAFADREFFFGRERQAFALYRLLESGRFIAVVGSSGSGKSSLVLAGLLKLLADERDEPGGPNWVCLDMRPGDAPIVRLAGQLTRLAEAESPDEHARRRERVEYQLRQSGFSLESALEEAGGLGGRSLLLIVDQFEELFRFGLAGLGPRRPTLEETQAREEATHFVQILLDADRRRLKDVHVLITMRSDFIGDCAYFHGLSEAASATQYLVPMLTRGQIEDAIRKPVEKAGASIEPELIESLINDCGDELDQLPVLQHCLMRIWDLAGAESGGAPRRLTRETYDRTGRMADALSRHADEVLAQCVGKDVAVEQTFRALSELDREGRATRRALRFNRLLAETGVSETDLRDLLDRCRQPSCSFLVPSPLAAPILRDERIDIGHEALLRRWKKIAGDPDKIDPATGRAVQGWLAAEQSDGQRYRALLSMLEDVTAGDRPILAEPERKKAWLESLPRTAAWADRYGGNLDGVKALIEESIADKKQAKRNRWIAASAAVAFLCALAGGSWIVWQKEEARRLEDIEREEARRQEDIDKSAMGSAKTLVEDVLHAFNDKALDTPGAESLAVIAEQFLEKARAASKTTAADIIWAGALNADADLNARLNKTTKALASATKAKAAALSLTAANPSAQPPLQTLYDASIRVGDALSDKGPESRVDAFHEYAFAVGVAEKIVSSDGGVAGDYDLIDAHLKIGDMHMDSKEYPEALAEYQTGLEALESTIARRPASTGLERNKGKVFFRIAELYRKENAFDEGRNYYDKAGQVQEALVASNTEDAIKKPSALDLTLKSNLAATYTHWGLLERTAEERGPDPTGDALKPALEKLQRAVAIDEELVKAEPGNPQWEDAVSPTYGVIADILDRMQRPKEALVFYQKYFDSRRALAFRGLGPVKAQIAFAEAGKLLGDHSSGSTQIDAYRATVRTWSRLVDDPKHAMKAAEQFAVMLDIAAVFDKRKDWPDAQAAYHVASKMAEINYSQDPTSTAWRDQAESAEKASAQAEVAAEAAPPPP